MVRILLALILSSASVAWAESARDLAVREAGYVPWSWGGSDCFDCAVYFLPKKERTQFQDMEPHELKLHTRRVQVFMKTLAERKSEIMRLYRMNGQDYNFVALMAIGILGQESQFFTHPKYELKELFPGLVRWEKERRARLKGEKADASSRGPTQIKNLPQKIATYYGITPDTLYRPEHAAVATVGFLAESLARLRSRIVTGQLDFITESNYADYLPYLYYRGPNTPLNRELTPAKNVYIQGVQTYMGWVQVYEGPSLGISSKKD